MGKHQGKKEVCGGVPRVSLIVSHSDRQVHIMAGITNG